MSLFYVINNFSIGGAETGLLHLIDSGFFDGQELRIVGLFRGTGALLPELEKRSIAAQVLVDQADMSIPKLWLAYRKLRKLVREQKPETMLLSLPQANILGRLAAGCRRKGIQVISFEHNMHYAKRIYGSLLKLTSCRVDRVFYDAEATRKSVGRYYMHKLDWIYVPLIAIRSQHPKEGYQLSTPPKLLGVGRLNPQKNYRQAIQAVHLLKQRGIQVEYYIAGEGAQQGELEKLIHTLGLKKEVKLLGFVKDWTAHCHEYDIFLQASTREGLCISVIEAMAEAMPVVATNVGGMTDYGKDGVNMAKTSGTNAGAIARRLEDIMQDDALREKIGKQAYQDAQEQFGEAVVQQQLVKAKRNVILKEHSD